MFVLNEISDMGLVTYVFGIRNTSRDGDLKFINYDQEKHLKRAVKGFSMEDLFAKEQYLTNTKPYD